MRRVDSRQLAQQKGQRLDAAFKMDFDKRGKAAHVNYATAQTAIGLDPIARVKFHTDGSAHQCVSTTVRGPHFGQTAW